MDGRTDGRTASFHQESLFRVQQAPVHLEAVAVSHCLQVIFFIEEIQGVVAGETPDGEFVGHFGPVLSIAGHPLVQLR